MCVCVSVCMYMLSVCEHVCSGHVHVMYGGYVYTCMYVPACVCVCLYA